MTHNAITHCGQVVREQDRDRFRMSLFEPLSIRPQIWAILAFNHEISKTREVVSETQIGHIRLQWWRERLQEIYNNIPGGWSNHAVLTELAQAVKKHDLPFNDFDRLIYAREFDLEDVPPSSIDGLEKYAEFTNLPLSNLMNAIEGANIDDRCVRDISTGYALTGLIRSIPYHARQNRVYLPSDLMQKHNVSLSSIVRGTAGDGLKNVVRTIHDKALALLSYPQSPSLFLDMSQLTALSYLKKIRKSHFDIYDKRLQNPSFSLFLQLFLKAKCQ